ncbi:MAG: S8 family serine peptidase [Actinomycetota bacterium]|nr:S8 family serine peptidase [Actinomycetota bacterium]
MRPTSPLLLTIVILSTALSSVPAQAAATEQGTRGRVLQDPDHVLVKFGPGTPAAQPAGSRAVIEQWFEVPVRPGETPSQAVTRLSRLPGVEVVEPSSFFSLQGNRFPEAPPNDPRFDEQWHLPAAQVPKAWTKSSGRGVTVAVIDTGITREGKDLDCHQFVDEFDAVTGETGPGAARDDHGHGTHVAGTVAQCTNNKRGVAGVAFGASLLPIDVFQDVDGLQVASAADVALGIDWARRHGADVINLSLGFPCFNHWPHCQSRVVTEAIEAALAADILIVAAAGNYDSSFLSFPANHPEVIGVGAVTRVLQRAGYSNHGGALDIAAPGGDTRENEQDGVLQETFEWLCRQSEKPITDYCFLAGTSMANPHVTGAAALMRAHVPGAGRRRVRAALECTARDLGPAGWDPAFGAGLVQAHDALVALARGTCWPPEWPTTAHLSVSEVLERSLELDWSRATDEVGVSAYRIHRDGKLIAQVPGSVTTHHVTGLQPSTAYTFRVQAGDQAGNWSTDGPSLSVTTATDFADTNGSIFEEDIAWLAGAGITQGCAPRLYCPGEPVTRAQMAAFLLRALPGGHDQHLPPFRGYFSDVPGGLWYTGHVEHLFEHQITRGCGGARYCPGEAVTRAQMAAFLVRAFGLSPTSRDFFSDDEGHPLEAAINALAAADVTRGCVAGAPRYCPEDPVTRGEMAAFLRRVLSR